MQNIADMRNIESDINQNIDKIIMKIDIQDFMQILEKYALKLQNFSIIKDLLKKEKASIGKFTGLGESEMQEIENKFQTMFAMGQMGINYLESNPQADIEGNTSISVSVSFENKEIFENAIKLSKLEEKQHMREQEEYDQLQAHRNFSK